MEDCTPYCDDACHATGDPYLEHFQYVPAFIPVTPASPLLLLD